MTMGRVRVGGKRRRQEAEHEGDNTPMHIKLSYTQEAPMAL